MKCGRCTATRCARHALDVGVRCDSCERDWQDWSRFVAPGGRVVLHDARADRPGGRGLPGPTAVVARRLREPGTAGWEIVAEADRTVAAQRTA